MQTEVDRSLLCTSKVSQAWHVLRPKSMTSTLFRGLMPESFFRPLACSHDNRTTDNINCVTFEPAHPCRCTERGSRTARESRRTRPVQQSAKKSTRRCKPNTSLHSHSLHITNAPAAGGPRSRRGSRWKGRRRRRRRPGSRRTAPSSAAPPRHRGPRRR